MKIDKAIEAGSLSEHYLSYLPLLRNCKDWSQVKEVSFINHHYKNIKYYGLIVKYDLKNYFLEYRIIHSLAKFRKWNLSEKLKITRYDSKINSIYNKKYL